MTGRPVTFALLLSACLSPPHGTISDPCGADYPPQTVCGGPPYTSHPPASWCDDVVRGESVTVRLPRGDRSLDVCGTCVDGGVRWDWCDEADCLGGLCFGGEVP